MRSGFGVHTMHHFMLPKLRLVFSQRTCPIHFLRPKTKFLGGFARFRYRVVPVVRSGFGVHTMHHFVLPKWHLVFSQRTCPIYFFRPKTKFLGGFARFRPREVPIVRSGFGVHTMHHFVLAKLRLVFATKLPIPLFLAQNLVSGWFRAILLLGGTRCEIGFSRAYNPPLYASEVASCFFATNMPNPLL